MKKKVLIGLIIIVLVILLFPRRNTLNNGGTIEYKSVVYKVSKVHRYKIDGKYNNNFENGIIIELFGKEIYNNVEWIFKNLFSFFFLVLIFLLYYNKFYLEEKLVNNGRNLYDFDGVIYRGNCSFDFFMYCLTYYPNIFKYVPRYVVDYILIKNRLIDIDNKSYDFCRFLLDVKDVDDLILSFWNHNITKINKWYKEQMKSNDLIITGSPDFLMNPICEYLNIESLSSVVDKNTGIVTMFCYRENKATVLEKKYPNQIFNSFYTDNIYDDRFLFDSANTVYSVKGKIKIKIK